MNIDATIDGACGRIPGLVSAAVLCLPDGFVIGATRGVRMLDMEPLIRSAARCLTGLATPLVSGRSMARFVEYMFVIEDQLVVVESGRKDPRLALVVTATRDHNLGFVLGAVRLVMGEVENLVDLSLWGL